MKLKLFKKDELENERDSFIDTNAMDYRTHNYSLIEMIINYIVAFAAVFVVSFIFYESATISILFSIIGGFAYLPLKKKSIVTKKNVVLQRQFKDFLESLTTSIGAGRTVNAALISANEELEIQYSSKSYIVKEINGMLLGMRENYGFDVMLEDLSKRTLVEDIKDFSDVFSTCESKGMDTDVVIGKTVKVINEKSEIKMDIETMITSKKTELNAIMVMPIVFVFLIKSLGGGMIDLSSPIGRVASTVSLSIFIISYFISRKILDIKI